VNTAARATALHAWYAGVAGIECDPTALACVAGDASFRRYFRLARPDAGSVVLCDAPPDREKNREFVAVASAFGAAGVRVPRVLAADPEQGFLALEDLGDRLLLPELNEDNVDGYYGLALAMLERLALIQGADLPAYDASLLGQEMDLFPEWFCEGLLGLELDEVSRARYRRLRSVLIDRALAQAQIVVHRDFHARNLMLIADDHLATIDFQDAVIGPLTYDPVSLLRDCYRRWPPARVRDWALQHRAGLISHGMRVPGEKAFLTDFDWMGLQRHIKVLGIFSRLKLRDGKGAYLGDLPRVMTYVREVLAAYPDEPALADFGRWFDDEVLPRAGRQPWFTAT
jgi:aminoglycoside/choline kinase family phosphotransferase